MRKQSQPPRDDSWIDYHREMTAKHDYFVRGGGIKPYYTNEAFDDIKPLKGEIVDIYDCNWERDSWNTMPYFTRKGNNVYEFYALPTTLYPNHSSYSFAGRRVNGVWNKLQYRDTAGDFMTTFMWTDEGDYIVNHNGLLFLRHSCGTWTTALSKRSELKEPPIDELMTQLRRINGEKWRGFFKPIIDSMIDEGVISSQI